MPITIMASGPCPTACQLIGQPGRDQSALALRLVLVADAAGRHAGFVQIAVQRCAGGRLDALVHHHAAVTAPGAAVGALSGALVAGGVQALKRDCWIAYCRPAADSCKSCSVSVGGGLAGLGDH